jgi:1,4-alpha-glucan branching enzyme
VTKSYFTFILHSHLPWVLGHGRWPHGTDWLNEAVAECYIPLLQQLFDLTSKGYHPHLTIGLTPILQEQLRSNVFPSEFQFYLDNKITAAEDDSKEFSHKGQSTLYAVAQMWHAFYINIKEEFNGSLRGDIISGFKKLQDNGYLEIITSAATHGYLPLIKHDRSINAQIQLGIQTYQTHFDKKPRGIWLPECAYRPSYEWTPPVGRKGEKYTRKGIDEFLSAHGLQYFVTDSHMLKGGKAIGVYLSRFKALKNLWQRFEKESVKAQTDVHKTPHDIYLVASDPSRTPVAVFTRDPKTALQVWSGDMGYPGESCYLDFHKKRFPGGLRYWSVTDPKIDMALKQIYTPHVTEEKIISHARHFVALLRDLAEQHYHQHNRPALICTPFDTELFGHWWFEGPRWLYHVLKIIEEDDMIELVTGSTAIEILEPEQVIALPEGSWGEGGFHYIWLNQWTEWTWKRLYEIEDEFYILYKRFRFSTDDMIISILKQLAREFLLLQSSDWQFLISTWSARDYAELRFSHHYENFQLLSSALVDYSKDNHLPDSVKTLITEISHQDNCFPHLDLAIFD